MSERENKRWVVLYTVRCGNRTLRCGNPIHPAPRCV